MKKMMIIDKLTPFIRRLSGAGLFVLCLLAATACSDEQPEGGMPQRGRAVIVTAALPDDYTLSRAAAPKESFAKDDVIHMYADFLLDDGTHTSAYACLRFDGLTSWTAFDGTTLEWPWKAVSATFKAYYIPPVTVGGTELKNNTAMSGEAGRNTLGYSLSDLTAGCVARGVDPLAATYTDIPAESAVHLQFNHLLSKLTFTRLGKEANFSGQLTDKERLYLVAEGLKDSCLFQREAGLDALSHALETNKGYLAGQVEPGAEGDGSYTATFLIPPVEASGIDLKLQFKDFSPYHLVPVRQALEAGKHYSLDITKLADNYWGDDLKEEEWNKNQAEVDLNTADINQYLTAIRDGMEFRKNGLQVLDVYTETAGGKTTTVVTQLRDVNFNNQPFTPVSLSTNIIFQGNRHRIKNLFVQEAIDENGRTGSRYQALFGQNEGTIRGLRVEGAKTGRAAAEYVGTLVGFNRGTGTIEDVRIEFKPGDVVQGAEQTAFIGGLAGANEGTIVETSLGGSSFGVKVDASVAGETYYIGGLVGYNSGASSTVREARVQASGSTVGFSGSEGYVYIGGWSGYSDADHQVQACATSMGVQATGGREVHIGGFSGLVDGPMEKCAATGAVQLPVSAALLEGGGFAGLAVNVTLNACYATGNLSFSAASPAGASVGGFAGRLAFAGLGSCDLLNCFAIGRVPGATYGGFAAGASDRDDAAAVDPAKVAVRNSFSRNNASAFLGNDGATLVNFHHNGEVNGSPTTKDQLNAGKPAGGFEWVDRPALYGDGFPYFTIK